MRISPFALAGTVPYRPDVGMCTEAIPNGETYLDADGSAATVTVLSARRQERCDVHQEAGPPA